MPAEVPGEISEHEAQVRAQLAVAEQDHAEATAQAAAARARAAALRGEPDAPPGRGRRFSAARLALGFCGVVIGAAFTLSALMVVAHRGAAAQRHHDGQIVEAARAGVTALLSISHQSARADVQRVLDLTTGPFREDFAGTADDFVATAEKSKAVTKGVIKAAALESAQADGGVVLVAANSEVTNAQGARADARPFRMSVTVRRDGEEFKMSNLEFVP